jgi:hypothetical protein
VLRACALLWYLSPGNKGGQDSPIYHRKTYPLQGRLLSRDTKARALIKEKHPEYEFESWLKKAMSILSDEEVRVIQKKTIHAG